MDETPAETGDAETFTPGQCDWYEVGCQFDNFTEFLIYLALWIPRKSFELFSDALASVIESLPSVPGAQVITDNASAFAAGGYLIQMFAVKEGLALVVTALIARFLLRRIPFIGG